MSIHQVRMAPSDLLAFAIAILLTYEVKSPIKCRLALPFPQICPMDIKFSRRASPISVEPIDHPQDISHAHTLYPVNNAIATMIVADLLGLIGLNSFRTGAVLLLGLLAYDVFWVFGATPASPRLAICQFAFAFNSKVNPASGNGDYLLPCDIKYMRVWLWALEGSRTTHYHIVPGKVGGKTTAGHSASGCVPS